MEILNAWYVAAWADELTTEPLARTILNQLVVLYRDKTGRACALEDRCCHRGAPLSLGRVVENGLQCMYHGLTFDQTGACVHIPVQNHIPNRARVKSYPVEESDEMVWIWMGDPEAAEPGNIVKFPYHNDHQYWPHKHTTLHVNCRFDRLVDNLMDLTHLAYVHESTIGGFDPGPHMTAETEIEPVENGVHYIRWLLGSNPPPTYEKAVPALEGKTIDRWMDFEFVAPSHVIQWTGALAEGRGAKQNREQEGGFQLRIFHSITPETDGSCHYFFSTCNGFRPEDSEATDLLFEQVSLAFNQDKVMVEGQEVVLQAGGEKGLVALESDQQRLQTVKILKRMEKREKRPAAG